MLPARTAGAAALAFCASVLVGHAQSKASGEELVVFPSSLAMGSRGERSISVATRSGKFPSRVEWSISNGAVASLTPHGPAVDVRAVAAGRAVITARVNGRTVTASITVAEEPELRLGTTRWSLPPSAGLTPRGLLDASRVDDDGAELFAVDVDPMKRFALVRAVRADGTLVWQSTIRGTPWAGDRFGGLLVRMGPLDQPSRTLARFDRPKSAVPAWRYRARGDIDDFGQADDGTIFLTIQTHPRLANARDENGEVVALDGRTGLEIGHFKLAVSSWQTTGTCSPKTMSVRRPSELGSLGEGSGGGLYAELLVVHDTWTRACERGRPVPGRGRFKVSRELQLVRLTRRGLTAVRSLWRSDVEGPDTVERLRAIEDVAPGPITELKSGELLALRTQLNLDAAGRLTGRLNIARLARGGDLTREIVRPAALSRASRTWRVLIDAPDTARVYVGDGTTLQAINLDSGATAWSMDTPALPFEAVETNTVIANDQTRNQVMEVNFRGSILRTFPARVDDARIVASGQGVIHGVEPQTHAVVEVQQPAYIETGWSALLDVSTSFDDARRRFGDFLLEAR